jgi:hypothetical protein
MVRSALAHKQADALSGPENVMQSVNATISTPGVPQTQRRTFQGTPQDGMSFIKAAGKKTAGVSPGVLMPGAVMGDWDNLKKQKKRADLKSTFEKLAEEPLVGADAANMAMPDERSKSLALAAGGLGGTAHNALLGVKRSRSGAALLVRRRHHQDGA